MKPYILDLREERCPMALLLAKKMGKELDGTEFVVQICDSHSMNDIVRFFTKQGIPVSVEETVHHYVLTVNSMRAQLDV